MAYNTGNPIGSTDPRDLLDNSQIMDKLVNGSAASVPDRFGVSRRTIAGMESAFDSRMASLGYDLSLGDYAAGKTITDRGQVVLYSGEYYKAAASVSLPLVLTGTWGTDSSGLVGVGDGVLRQELVANANDFGLLPEIANYAALRVYTGPVTAFLVRGVANIFDGGFGVFRVDAPDTTTADNGGTVIVDAGGRRWKRDYSGEVNVKWFGAKGNGTTDDTAAIQAAIDFCTVNFTNPTKLYFPYGVYKTTNTLTVDNTIHMVGDKGAFNGSASYIKLYSASDIPAVYVGTGTSTYVYNFFMQDLCITRDGINTSNYNTDKTGLFLDRVSESLVKNCAIGGFKYGIVCHEVTITDFDKLQVYYNETGIWLQDQKPGGSTAYTNGMNNFFRCNIFKNKYGVSLGGELNHFIGCHFEISETATFYIDNALSAQTRHINIKDCNIRSDGFNTTRALLINQGDTANPLRVFQVNIEGAFASSNSSPYAIEVNATALTSHNVKVNISNSSFFGVATSAAYSNAATTVVSWEGQIRVRQLVTGGGTDMPRTSGTFSADGRRAGVMMKLSANHTTTNNLGATLSWGTAVYNNYGFWAAGSPTRLTIPNDVRMVKLHMSAMWATNANGFRIIDVVKNGGNDFDGRSTVSMNAANTTTCQELVSPIIPVSPGDYFEFRATQSSGGGLDVVAGPRTWVAIEVIE